jgi:hypothetical protein
MVTYTYERIPQQILSSESFASSFLPENLNIKTHEL